MPRLYPATQPLSRERLDALLADSAQGQVLDQIHVAQSLADIEAARVAQHAWLQANPDDSGMFDAGEWLGHLEEALLEMALPPALGHERTAAA